ncbi:MAG TPA: hypothetical protein VKA67_00220 [Verrucomicrobiae bacterium]|nr:hypothetical protein [Verrucomicrobiae bacterium]
MLEIISEATGRCYKLNARAFGKVLHLARQQGWYPERVAGEWPAVTWDTEIILPHLGPYMPGRVSRADAEDLRKALTRALATGAVDVEGTVYLAATTLLQLAREGSFRVRLTNSNSSELVASHRQDAY